MPRGGGRGGNHQAQARARGGGSGQNTTRDRRYNVRDVGQGVQSGDNTAQPPKQSYEGPHNNSSQKGTTRNRRPAANAVSTGNNEVKKEIPKNPSKPPLVKKNDDPDYLFRSKLPVENPQYGYGVRYNPNDPNEKIPVTKLYVSRIGNATKADITKSFSQFGAVVDVVLKLKDQYEYAFVTFLHHKDALKALASDFTVRKYKPLVKEALQTHQPMPSYIDKLAAITAPDACYIDKLNDDCLRHIFLYLDLVTRTRVEVVCRNWHRLSRAMWLVVRSLDFTSPPLSTHLKEGSSEYDFFAQHLTSLTGHNLSSLVIKRFNTTDTLKAIRNNCTALESLTLHHFTLHDANVVLPSLKILKYLNLEGCSLSDKLLSKLFSFAKSLVSVSVTRQATGTSFIELLERLHALSLRSCDVMHPHFSKFLARNGPTLKSLRLFRCRLDEEMYENTVELVASHVPHLESLTLDMFYRSSENLRLDALYKLSQLRFLSLCLNKGLTSDILLRISRNCHALESLNLDCSSGLSTEAVAALGKLPRLASLSLCHIPDINGLKNEAIIGLVNNLASPTQLRHLHLANTALSDEALYAVLSLCVALETLNLSMCRCVTEATLMTAEDAVATRTSEPLCLTLNIDDTPIQSAVEAAAASGKRFHPRLLFRASNMTLPRDVSLAELPLDDASDVDSSFSGDGEDLLHDLIDSDDEYMYLMGLGIDPHDFDDFLGYRLGMMQLDSDEDEADPYEAFQDDLDPAGYFPH